MVCGLHTPLGAEITSIIQSARISLHVRVFDLPNKIVLCSWDERGSHPLHVIADTDPTSIGIYGKVRI